MVQIQSSKQYDLQERTEKFAKRVRSFIGDLPKRLTNIDDAKQLIRSSGSVGANYIEACECLSRKDFFLRLKICKKEARESIYWLNLISTSEEKTDLLRRELANEATELMKIFGAIITKNV